MAHIKLSRFNLEGAKKTDEPDNAVNIDYNLIKRQVEDDKSEISGNWFELIAHNNIEDFKADNLIHPDFKSPLIPIIYCKTINGVIDTRAKLCGAPEPPFRGQETAGSIGIMKKIDATSEKYLLEEAIITKIIKLICPNFFEKEIIPFYLINDDIKNIIALEDESKIPHLNKIQYSEDDENTLSKNCCSIVKNFYVRRFSSEKNFEYELALFLKNLEQCDCGKPKNNCYNGKNILLLILNFYLALIYEHSEEFPKDHNYYAKAKELFGEFKLNNFDWLNEFLELIKAVLKNKKNGNLENIHILVSLPPFGLMENMKVSNLVNSRLIVNNDIKTYYSIDKTIYNYLLSLKQDNIVFILGHGDEVDGVIYYHKNEKDYMRSSIFRNNNIDVLGFFSCTTEMYKGLYPEINHVILPKDSTSDFEIAEMFVKSFIGCYKRTSDYKLSLKIANYSCQIFPYKKFEFYITGL